MSDWIPTSQTTTCSSRRGHFTKADSTLLFGVGVVGWVLHVDPEVCFPGVVLVWMNNLRYHPVTNHGWRLGSWGHGQGCWAWTSLLLKLFLVLMCLLVCAASLSVCSFVHGAHCVFRNFLPAFCIFVIFGITVTGRIVVYWRCPMFSRGGGLDLDQAAVALMWMLVVPGHS